MPHDSSRARRVAEMGGDRPRSFTCRPLLALAVALALSAFLSGCAEVRVAQYTKLKEQQDWAGALKTIREEIASPVVQTDSYRGDLRIIALGALGNYANFHGPDQRLDDEAMRYYQEGLRYSRNDSDRQAGLPRTLAVYYTKTGRPGLALPYLRKDLDYWKKANNTYQIIAGYDGLASAYNDMGEVELEDHYRAQALEVAKDYFLLGVRPTDPHEWLQYEKMLLKRMDRLARPGNAAELEKLWTLIEPITIRYVAPKFLTYKRAAEYFALAGDTRRATELFAKAEGQWAKERESQPRELQARAERDFSCALASIQVHSRQYASAVGEFDRCAKLTAAVGMKSDDFAFQQLRGLAYEGVGDLDRAIEAYRAGIDVAEKVRGSYTVAERAAFFRSIPRRSYWGLVRSLTRRGLAKNDSGDFVAALRASELMRARQLGEILDAKAEAELSSESLERLRRSLRPDEVILAYTLTDTEMVLLALAQDRQIGAVIPYDSQKFRAEVLTVAKDLADPGSDVALVSGQLVQLGRVLLGPAQGVLGGKKRIMVIPDGVVNAIPFDLLSVQAGEYRALISDYTVRLAPSLRFIEHAGKPRRERQGEGLFALGDPVYAKGPQIAGLSETDLRAVTRGSQYLKYFDPLPETRTEVEAIARLFGAERVETLFGQKAAESAVKRADLRGFRYVHFATHGIIGGDVPGLGEPALVLAEEPGEDGFLTASEAAQLKLDADLTVLSACKTGTGEHFTGEGVMGMSRAFLVAGSKSVLVSLWSVESKATERLMVAFYRHLRAGQEAPEALRKAKLDMIDAARAAQAASRGTIVVTPGPMPGWREIDESHPFFWAPFILFGG